MFDQAITVAIEIMVLAFFYVSLNIGREKDKEPGKFNFYYPLQVLFLVMGLVFQTLNLDLMRQIATDAGKTGIANTVAYGYDAMIWVTVLALFYIMIMFFWAVALALKDFITEGE